MYRLQCKENYYLTLNKTRILTIRDRDLCYDRDSEDIEEFWSAVDDFIEDELGFVPDYEVC